MRGGEGRRGGCSHGSLRCLLWGESRGSQGSLRRWLWAGEAGILMEVPDAGCWRLKRMALMAIPDAFCARGEEGFLMAVSDAGCGRERQGFSWQSQMLVVGGRRGFSWQLPTLVVGGEAGVIMAVTDAGCGGLEAVCSSMQSQALFVGELYGGSHGRLRHCLWGGGRDSHGSLRR